ncbi:MULTISPECIES: hypothetical protein [Pseudoalteromonas]|uniref:Uncharacterized protein n=1 Tax=Pseudoalteromonas amylolytica TaxID=1859457 RepID=A0A1S1MSY6_9GAMM|nr:MULTISPECIES: hypothetical protein [Pseudoalteromonas]OHU85498.1 hypothetical protein BFC16_19305 [Pseudoalteromonas sp. JW3]OHU91732.1 hypothetical protein BET10_08000 [Pseudoalteromonas amylolytica]
MNTFVVLLWKDARIATNELHGVVEIDEHDIARLVAEKYEDESGNKVNHYELRGIVTEADELYANLPRLELGLENL